MKKLKSTEKVKDRIYNLNRQKNTLPVAIKVAVKEDRQHLIQTIRKEVEGMPEVEELIIVKGNTVKRVKRHPQKIMRKDILDYLTTLEEEV